MTLQQPYQSAGDDWIVFDGVEKRRFASALEAWGCYMALTDKQECAQKIVDLATVMAQYDEAQRIMTSRGYRTGGADEIVDADIEGICTADQFNNLCYILEQVSLMIANQAHAMGNFLATIDLVRSDY